MQLTDTESEVEAAKRADLDRVIIRDPEVPRSLRYPVDRKAPSRKRRAEAQHLAEDREWYLDGAHTEEWGKLRSARLSRKTAVHYWDRFCLFIALLTDLDPMSFPQCGITL